MLAMIFFKVCNEKCQCGLSLCKICLTNHTSTPECLILTKSNFDQQTKNECLTVLRLWQAQCEDRDLALRHSIYFRTVSYKLLFRFVAFDSGTPEQNRTAKPRSGFNFLNQRLVLVEIECTV